MGGYRRSRFMALCGPAGHRMGRPRSGLRLGGLCFATRSVSIMALLTVLAAATNHAYALPGGDACPFVGASYDCLINGEPGTQLCADGHLLQCKPILPNPSPAPPASVRVVVPNSAETAEGGCSCDYPFNVTYTHPDANSTRFQQIYPASQFTALSSPMFITQIAFRPAASTCNGSGVPEVGTAFGLTKPPPELPVEISLSTTTVSAEFPYGDFSDPNRCIFRIPSSSGAPYMSCRFSDNIGEDKKVVFSGTLTLSSADTITADGTTAFDIRINLQHPFPYDRTKGNLLLDIKNFMNPTTTFFDTVAGMGQGDQTFRIDADDVTALFGFIDEPAPVGVVTRFQFDPRPISFTEYPIPTADSGPRGITAGPDGNLWFTEAVGNKIGRITTDGMITEFSGTPALDQPFSITAGPDGNLWFTDVDANKIGRITTDGMITEFSLPRFDSFPQRITAGPDGNLWFTEGGLPGGNKIGRITTDGVINKKEFPVPTPAGAPNDITAGPDRKLWFTEFLGNKIGRISTNGRIREFLIPTDNSEPLAITAGPDANLWFTEGNAIGRITTDGEITEFSTPNGAGAITAGSDGALWFTEGNAIGRITTDGEITEFSTPTDSAPAGITVGPDGDLWFTEFAGNKIDRAHLVVIGDINDDGKVDCSDLAIVRASLGKRTGQPGFDARADVISDDVVDVRDLAFVAQRLPAGTHCRRLPYK
jgi:streptogramin lyase